MKILERNPGIDLDGFGGSIDSSASAPAKCLFDATQEKDWDSSKYHKGFGCGRQFFIGISNADALT